MYKSKKDQRHPNYFKSFYVSLMQISSKKKIGEGTRGSNCKSSFKKSWPSNKHHMQQWSVIHESLSYLSMSSWKKEESPDTELCDVIVLVREKMSLTSQQCLLKIDYSTPKSTNSWLQDWKSTVKIKFKAKMTWWQKINSFCTLLICRLFMSHTFYFHRFLTICPENFPFVIWSLSLKMIIL